MTTPDNEPLETTRLDIVDERGVVRITLTAESLEAVVDGRSKDRIAPFAGIILRDEDANERGGLGWISAAGGRPIIALDHSRNEAIGITAGQDGSVMLFMNKRGDDNQPPSAAPTPLLLQVDAQGTPSISLSDAHDRPRLRLTLRADGAGVIEFLDATGEVVHVIVPEDDRRRSTRSSDVSTPR